VHHPSLLEVLELPKRYSGDHVVDLQHEALRRLRAKQDVLVDNSRSNMSVQLATHEAVLAMMEARTLDEFIGIIQDEVPILLDIDMACVALEGAVEAIDISADGMPVLLPSGEIQKRLGDDDVQLIADVAPGDDLFGAARDLVQSVAIARLYPSEAMPAGLLILGSRDANTFHPQQGTELITFMARVAEILVEKWLEQEETSA
jgi:uncharacterized protein YigA (DUF484 family)